MFKNFIYYLIGIAFFGWIVANLTKLFLQFMPYVFVGILLALPFYGLYRKSKKLDDKKYGLKRFVVWLAGIFKFSKRSWTFYLVLGIAIGFVYEDMVWMMVRTLSWTLVGLYAFWMLWEGTRLAISKVSNYQVVSFKEALKDGWK